MQDISNKPIAYRSGSAGPIFHTDCWPAWQAEYQAKSGCKPFLGAIYYPGAEREQLLFEKCGVCGMNFPKYRKLRVKPTGHSENGWQYHYKNTHQYNNQ